MSCGSNGSCGCSGGSLGGYGGCNDSCPSVHIFDWLPESSKAGNYDHCDLVEVSFKARRRKVYQNTRNLPIRAGDEIIVSAQRGLDYGKVALTGELVHIRARNHLNYGQILRIASSNDRRIYHENQEAEKDALVVAKASINLRQLPLKLVDTEWQFDRKRLTIFYTTSSSVSLKPVISELCRRFSSRVEFLRLNPREEASRVGGLGVCGRELCCSSWMRQIPPVSASAARKMHLPFKTERLVGRCGQLKCCLNYELEQYMRILKKFPRKGTIVGTVDGNGGVIGVNIFERTVKVILDNDLVKEFELSDVKKIKSRPYGGQRMSRKRRKPKS
ncbi:MAG: regulatory iron-sulfur-containing complex subunit RicT [Bacteroidetes bacterium]|nr:regulatory iron-sulfur-containing complex subunit RicT [Bacteroidota bacterium]